LIEEIKKIEVKEAERSSYLERGKFMLRAPIYATLAILALGCFSYMFEGTLAPTLRSFYTTNVPTISSLEIIKFLAIILVALWIVALIFKASWENKRGSYLSNINSELKEIKSNILELSKSISLSSYYQVPDSLLAFSTYLGQDNR
jgi:hypothetical protein